MKQINKIAAALSTRSSEVCSSVTAPQKAISPGQAQQTLIKSEAERETQRVTCTVTSLSIYVRVCKVKNNLQRFCLEFITILTDTTSRGGGDEAGEQH